MTQPRQRSLREHQHPAICQLANIIETNWRGQLVTYAYDTPTDLGHVEGLLEGERLTIENYCYQTPQFRKLHLELAKVGKNLDILHCVMFPRVNFHLPIFGVDIVAGPGGISAAIVDLSPVTPNQTLPIAYQAALTDLPAVAFSQPRDLPSWGDIFSRFCLFVRPMDSAETNRFIDQVTQYLSIHCQLAASAVPTQSPEEYQTIVAGQQRYCSQQQQNDKTRRILERAFGSEWADRYLQTMLFDCVNTTEDDANVTVSNALSV